MQSYMHLKAIKDMRKSTALETALCGRKDPGTLFYMDFDPNDKQSITNVREQLAVKDSGYETCPWCLAAFSNQFAEVV